MATALRFVARKVCSRALQRPQQPCFPAAASPAVKEEQSMLLPRISHGGSSLRRFSSSETPNFLNNNKKHLPGGAKSGAIVAEPTESLAKRVEEKKHELLHLLRQLEGESSMGSEQKELQQLLQCSTNKFVLSVFKVFVGGIVVGKATSLAIVAMLPPN
ncbi:hypothetical protein D1007_14037 [Hordeum vulgare]|uniref:Predicted protein n=1 Tax=Hordeum vulgare subsp. vulgare TaxID=112509 RepID=F2CYY9_HORVV|nr:uncharacterized protein LOC123439665 [Hordeum vulgare subsp. vulgare]KAE8809358.1 hypothetical protein D1007_14037 [Hordeum vulgare]BAJ88060.1 predicted protein [Hordeum vulgare subsp. vulgare]